MGNREDLLTGAKRCLAEKGYGRTTARDIAAASGVSLAAIGYHFGSKETLLNTALIEAVGEWGDALHTVVVAASASTDDPEERFIAVWDGVMRTFVENRGLWTAQLEAIAQVDHAPELKEMLGHAQKEARLGLASVFQGLEEVPENDDELARGAFYQALLAGLAALWVSAPEHAPSGRDLLHGLRLVGGSVLNP
ncbi:TetR/AcrR family transcriptional regulator [Kitasatospora sp. NPDC004240]